MAILLSYIFLLLSSYVCVMTEAPTATLDQQAL